jgi:tRNA pseudouridine13 synthase
MSGTGEDQTGISAYLTTTSGIGGRLRSGPEDFVVEELFSNGVPSLAQGDSHTVMKVRATNWETNHLLAEIARQLHVRREALHVAGMKDRRAITTQFISIHLPLSLTDFRLKDVEVIERMPVGEHVNLGDASGNRFEITLRGFDPDAADQIEPCREQILSAGGVPNFYGPQRFGSLRPITGLVGKAMTRRDFKKAVETYLSYPCESEDPQISRARGTPDPIEAFSLFPERYSYERSILQALIERPGDHVYALKALPKNLVMMFVHAYQSYIFNRVLSERLNRGLPIREPIEGDIMLTPSKERVPVARTNLGKMTGLAREGKARITGVIFGTDSEFADGEMGEIERKEIEREGVKPKDFIIPEIRMASSSGGRRPLLAPIDELEVSRQDDGSLGFRFSLGSGMYATCVMREFMKTHMRSY